MQIVIRAFARMLLALVLTATGFSLAAPDRTLAETVQRPDLETGGEHGARMPGDSIRVHLPSSELQSDPGAIEGVVVDPTTGETLPGAVIRLRELERSRVTDLEGRFVFDEVPPRNYTIGVQHLGYAPAEVRVVVQSASRAYVSIPLMPSVLELPDVVITGTGRERGISEAYKPTAVLAGVELQRQLGTTISSTISHLPGISEQYNGPAATQSVIRGMGGDRVLMLEDGQRTGDLSTTAGDHVVAIEPATAERVEVIRGPAGLLYGPNALGGVINVLRRDIPRTRPDRSSGAVTVQGESVSRGITGGATFYQPVGTFVIRGEISGRRAGDVHTPLGRLEGSDLDMFNASGGISYVRDWGFAGISGRQHSGRYGVPGEFGGVLIPGAHPGGVEAEFVRRAAQLRAGHLRGIGPFSTIEFDANLSHYRHDEIEGRREGVPVYGARFDQIVGSARAIAHHEHSLERLRTEGAAGISFYGRDLLAMGAFTGSRSAYEYAIAGFAYEEFRLNPFRIQVGARYDWTRMVPMDTRPIFVNDELMPVRQRDFGSFSGSFSALFEFHPGWTAGASISRAFRNPSVEELYSDGPHLADFSYDIGNPDLDSEIGLGVDLFLRAGSPRLNFEAGTFLNRVSNYIYYQATGDIDPRFHRFPVFQAKGEDAMFLGAESRVQWEFTARFVADVTVSYVRATRLDTEDPLPAIPPLDGRLQLRYDRGDFYATAGLRAATRQSRIPAPVDSPADGEPIMIERPTDGYSVLEAGVGYQWELQQAVHTIALQTQNLTDRVWRDHLSRIKDVVPQPGRNVRVVYRLQF